MPFQFLSVEKIKARYSRLIHSGQVLSQIPQFLFLRTSAGWLENFQSRDTASMEFIEFCRQ